MKEITRINLASLPYNIDIEAKKTLEKYCLEIEKSLNADVDAMREIELRMTELLAERNVTGETVISSDDVVALKEQLGSPDDFADDFGTADGVGEKNSEIVEEKSVRRMMRDTSNRMLGGVCSGLAAYFKLDPVLVRVIAILLVAITAGVAIPVYVLLWLIIPPARTAADRLEMAGKPVTLEAIQQESATWQDPLEPVLVLFMRLFVAGMLILAAGGVVFIIGRLLLERDFIGQFAGQPFWQTTAYLAGGLSAGLFVVILGLLAYALIVKKFTYRMGLSLFAIILTGLILFVGVSMFGYAGWNQSSLSEMKTSVAKKALKADNLLGAKRLIIKSTGEKFDINYQVTDKAPRLDLSYDTRSKGGEPNVSLQKTDDTVTIDLAGGTGCKGVICNQPSLVVFGPALDSVQADGQNISYLLGDQLTLTVDLAGTSSLQLYGETSHLDELKLKLSEQTALDARSAAVIRVTGVLKPGANLALGSVGNVSLTVPEACAANAAKTSLKYIAAKELKLNDKIVSDNWDQPCVQVSRDNY